MRSEVFSTEKHMHIVLWTVNNYLVRIADLELPLAFSIMISVGEGRHDVSIVEGTPNLGILIVMHESFT